MKCVSFRYLDVDYDDKPIIVSIPDAKNEDEFIQDFFEFARYYMDGYKIRELLGEKDALAREFPELNREDAEFFARTREEGLTVYRILSAFWKKYPKYKDVTIIETKWVEFNEYGVIIE